MEPALATLVSDLRLLVPCGEFGEVLVALSDQNLVQRDRTGVGQQPLAGVWGSAACPVPGGEFGEVVVALGDRNLARRDWTGVAQPLAGVWGSGRLPRAWWGVA
jgi:hypothetical protein